MLRTKKSRLTLVLTILAILLFCTQYIDDEQTRDVIQGMYAFVILVSLGYALCWGIRLTVEYIADGDAS